MTFGLLFHQPNTKITLAQKLSEYLLCRHFEWTDHAEKWMAVLNVSKYIVCITVPQCHTRMMILSLRLQRKCILPSNTPKICTITISHLYFDRILAICRWLSPRRIICYHTPMMNHISSTPSFLIVYQTMYLSHILPVKTNMPTPNFWNTLFRRKYSERMLLFSNQISDLERQWRERRSRSWFLIVDFDRVLVICRGFHYPRVHPWMTSSFFDSASQFSIPVQVGSRPPKKPNLDALIEWYFWEGLVSLQRQPHVSKMNMPKGLVIEIFVFPGQHQSTSCVGTP